MGLILDNNVKEIKIYQAYGLTAYGKINRYIWTLDNKEENALLTFRVTDDNENNIFSMYMGNNVILQRRIDDTMDNFLFWLSKEKPNIYTIEQQVYSSLCKSNSLFNYSIERRKLKEKNQM